MTLVLRGGFDFFCKLREKELYVHLPYTYGPKSFYECFKVLAVC